MTVKYVPLEKERVSVLWTSSLFRCNSILHINHMTLLGYELTKIKPYNSCCIFLGHLLFLDSSGKLS